MREKGLAGAAAERARCNLCRLLCKLRLFPCDGREEVTVSLLLNEENINRDNKA